MTDLDVEVALLAAETDYVAELIDRGILPPGARREPTTRELRAGVRFAVLDRIVVQAAALIVRATVPVRDHLLAHLTPDLPAGAGPYDAVAALSSLTVDDVEGLRKLVDTTVADVAGQLVEVAGQGAEEAIGEATRQGVPAHTIGTVDTDTDEVHAAAAAHATRIVGAAVTRLLEAAVEGASRAATARDATAGTVVEAAIAAATVTNGKL